MKEIKNNFSRNSKNSSAENKRANFIYELVGQISSKQLRKKKDGNPFYQLTVELAKEKNQKINVFADIKSKEIWQAIEQNKYYGRDYTFFCKNYMGLYYLFNWKELGTKLNNHGSN